MFPFVVIGLGVLGLLVWVGRRPSRLFGTGRLLSTLFAALAALGAVVVALRGGWIPSLILVIASAFLGQAARQGGPASRGDIASPMSAHEARTILGVDETADHAQITAAYRRLMQRAHPDHGGTAGLAAQINAARDRLLGRGGTV